ncbi:heme-binding Shp domain-containing protein [Geosporobacter ferrireducens]|uniref:NEAT domain-containing protein n=1 Tax=Geosporobacter ferrireducens TaxID=1424294 RepID=A0A1D8GG12_9FIRM|nr:heme-binding Shp domain-containing protein [Geosporobacter ferrireducens]AOT69848.1 hypothetical protein Gferi_09820 [Geosporobacter ferrireducens]
MKKRIFSFLMAIAVILGMTGVNAFALEDGIYMISNTTSYVNPDTGKTDDGGTDTSIGEAMARNMTYPATLYELKGGKHYITLRIKMVSYIDNIQFKVQEKKGEGKNYKAVSHTVVGENKEADTRDYRVEIPSMDLRINATFFVAPMKRNVTYFVSFDSTSVKADDGTFTGNSKKSGGSSKNETGKMPAVVETLTGVSEISPSKSEKKEPVENEVAAANIKTEANKEVSAGDGQQTANLSTVPAAADEKKELDSSKSAVEGEKKDSIETAAGKKEKNDEAAAAQSADHTDDPENVNAPGEETKTPIVEKEREELDLSGVQGLAEFDAKGEPVEKQEEKKSKNFGVLLAAAAIFCPGAAVYFARGKKWNT